MKKSIQFKIPNPCHESWGQMDKRTKGRFCSLCSKTVVDLTDKSQEYIQQIYEKTGGNMCGHIRAKQLGEYHQREAQLAYRLSSSWWKFRRWAIAASAALVLNGLTLLDSYAQEIQLRESSYTLKPLSIQHLDTVKIRGYVREKGTFHPLTSMRVHVKGIGTTILTDTKGYFELSIPRSRLKGKKSFGFEISGFGYDTLLIEDVPLNSYQLIARMEEDEELMLDGMMMLGDVEMEE